MPKLSKEDHECVLRDIVAIDKYVHAAMEGLDRKNRSQRALWDKLDSAIARLQGLSMFLSLRAEKG